MQLNDEITLTGSRIVLEPLSVDHIDGLREASAEFTDNPWYTTIPAPDDVPANVAGKLELHEAGSMNPFAIRAKDSGSVIGVTTFCNIDQPNRRVEVGHTWIAPSTHGSGVNPEAKLLLLQHAFGVCDVIAVQFLTHWHNHQSRAAIERLGARQDGVLRNHRIGKMGELRDTVVYSILPHEWPGVEQDLKARLRRRHAV